MFQTSFTVSKWVYFKLDLFPTNNLWHAIHYICLVWLKLNGLLGGWSYQAVFTLWKELGENGYVSWTQKCLDRCGWRPQVTLDFGGVWQKASVIKVDGACPHLIILCHLRSMESLSLGSWVGHRSLRQCCPPVTGSLDCPA